MLGVGAVIMAGSQEIRAASAPVAGSSTRKIAPCPVMSEGR